MNITTSNDLGLVIRQRRKALGWTQQRLADEAGVSRDWVLQVERGKDSAEVGLVLRLLHTMGLKVALSEFSLFDEVFQELESSRFIG